MALSAKLQLRQSQSLVMTPQLMQSIRLLQMTHLELARFIDEEFEKNPLLERQPTDADTGDFLQPSELLPEDAGLDKIFASDDASAETMAERLDTSMENVFPDDPGMADQRAPDLAAQWKPSASSNLPSAEALNIEDFAASRVTLYEHVREQIAFSFTDPLDRAIAYALGDAIDETGYLCAEIADIGYRLGVNEAHVLKVLGICQTFDPEGIFARDLSECLAIQLKARDRLDPAMQAMLAHLDLLARRDFAQLKRLCGVDSDDLLSMLAEVRTLDPKPGLAFSTSGAEPITPDVLVQPAADGTWTVEINPETLPRILVNNEYFNEVSQYVKNTQERDFLSECLQNANWLTRSLDQRVRTILKVATEIVRQQDAFLAHGVRHLRPLTLRTVADAIGMHESTVSRVTANKYMMTPRGVFELRYFFSVSLASAEGGEAHASEAVRDHIRKLIDAEEPLEVLSDDTIVLMLKEAGIDVARRTVAKYREKMNIPSSVQRRREKRAALSLRPR